LIDRQFRELKQDANVLINLLWLSLNIVSTGAPYASEILMETALLDAVD
jgi:hypothetical protein